jgi:hypothetical protein
MDCINSTNYIILSKVFAALIINLLVKTSINIINQFKCEAAFNIHFQFHAECETNIICFECNNSKDPALGI